MARPSTSVASWSKSSEACHDGEVLEIARRRATRHLVTAVSIVSVLVAGCASETDSSVDADVRGGVGVVAEGCGLTADVGSGAVIDHDGSDVVVTVAHTIRGASRVVVVGADGTEHEARVIAFDKDADLAALEVPSLDAASLAVGEGDDPLGPGSMLTWGRQDGVERVPVEIVKRLRVTIEDIYVDEVVERTAFEIAGPVTSGDSGGPVLDAAGDVVGIVYANSRGRERVGFASDHHELSELLASVTGTTVENGTCF